MISYSKVVFTSPWKAELLVDSIDDTNIPPNHVLLRKKYSLISAGTELACLSGGESWFPLPNVPGYCCIGEIVKKGDAVEGYEIGDKIFCYGNHSEYEVVEAGGIFLKVPEGVKEEYVPFVRMATIAVTAIRTSDIELGDYVAIVGQGLVGNLAGQLASLQGAFTIVIDVCESRLEIAKKCGADYIINPTACNAVEEIKRITNGKMVSTLIEATGNPKVALDNLDNIGKNGEIILLGSPRGEYSTNVVPALNTCHLADANITFKGAHEWKYSVNENPFAKHSMERNSKIMFELIKSSKLQIERLVTDIVKPSDCQKAYNRVRDNKEDSMGVLFDWTSLE